MKNVFLPFALLCCTMTTTFAQDSNRRNVNNRREEPIIRELRECQIKTDILRTENNSLNDRLYSCQRDQGDRVRLGQLIQENNDLLNRNRSLLDQVERLKIDNARLEIEAHPERGGRFNLAASILACGKISNAVYSQQCSAQAKAYSIQAIVIEQCSRITNAYYALECVKSAGAKETNFRQVEACVGIENAVYAQQCVQVAGEKRISPDVIRSCIQTSTNAFYQLECVKSM